MKKCSETDCPNKSAARGLCHRHYQRLVYKEKHNGVVKVYEGNGHKKGPYTWRPRYLLLDIRNQKLITIPKYVEQTLMALTQATEKDK